MAGPATPKNILTDYANWAFAGIELPWDGSQFDGSYAGESSTLGMIYNGTINAGDWLEFYATVSGASNPALDGIALFDGDDVNTGTSVFTDGAAHLLLEAADLAAILAPVSLTFVDSGGTPIGFTAITAVLAPGEPVPPATISFNCECDDDNPSRTLLELRTEMMRRLGFSTMTANPPPGMAELLDSFLQGAQRMLYRQYPVLRTQRYFTWNMEQGVRFYDLDANADTCTRKLDARMIAWAGISQGDDQWMPLVCGIPAECYQSAVEQGIPYRYDIRQCIEVWPAPSSDVWKLRIKGDFGLEAFAADGDKCTVDDEAVFLYALARAKAHYGQPDAANYQTDATNYIRLMTAGAHLTRRYVPGECIEPTPPLPRWIPKA